MGFAISLLVQVDGGHGEHECGPGKQHEIVVVLRAGGRQGCSSRRRCRCSSRRFRFFGMLLFCGDIIAALLVRDNPKSGQQEGETGEEGVEREEDVSGA